MNKKHEHKECEHKECEHINLNYCSKCDVVWCVDCEREWEDTCCNTEAFIPHWWPKVD